MWLDVKFILIVILFSDRKLWKFILIGVFLVSFMMLFDLILIFSLEKEYSMLCDGWLCSLVFLILKLFGSVVFMVVIVIFRF